MDPLAVLRGFVIDKKLDQVVESPDGSRIQFGDRYSFPKDVATAYKSQMGRGDLYPLSSLVFFMKNARKGGDLIKLANQAGVKPVTFIDRKDLEAYLTGEKENSDYIQLPTDDIIVPTTTGEPADDKGAKALADLLGRERSLRDRNTQLLVPGKSFASALTILATVQKRQQEKEASRSGSAKKPRKEVIPVMPSRRFDRPAGEGLAAMGIDEYKGQQIDAYGARKKTGDAASALPPLPPPPPPPPADDRPPLPQQPPAHRSRHQSSQEKHRPSSSGRSAGAAHKSQDKNSMIGASPIIIVPAAATATINMLNAKLFLEQGTYRFPQQVADEGGTNSSTETFMRTIGRTKPVRYRIVNKAPEKKSYDWKRVVAVFVSGANWQFKGWPFEGAEQGHLADTLSRMLGVYVGLKGEVMPENIKKWNVLKVEVPKDNRHRDRPIVQDIYTALDKFLAAHQSPLRY